MNFAFTEDQLLFRDSVRDFLRNEVTPERTRAGWENDGGDSLWPQLVELGLTGVTVAEEHGGLGMSVLDFVLLAEECGYVGLPEPLIHNALVAAPLLAAIGGDLTASWLSKIASGEAQVAVGAEGELVPDADRAVLLLIERGGALHAVEPSSASLRRNDSVDPSRRLFAVEFSEGERVSEDPGLPELARNLGALGAAAECLGLAQRMVDLSVAYTSERQQFGKPVGSFQAVKHHMADVAVRLEYARAPVYRAAASLASESAEAALHVSHAKLAACEAAALAAKHSIQVHGAMGYTWEVDLHIFMKRAWALAGAWGDTGFHKQRVADALFEQNLVIGAGQTF